MLTIDHTSRRTLSPRADDALSVVLVGLGLFASGVPSALYGTYQELWGFSPPVLTLVYATYAVGVLTTLLLAGWLSDHVGRRPVLLGALATLVGATVLFILPARRAVRSSTACGSPRTAGTSVREPTRSMRKPPSKPRLNQERGGGATRSSVALPLPASTVARVGIAPARQPRQHPSR
jgi:hypothetical protein